ncbi:MAG: RNA polymerase sigma-54 factor RpoN [Fluviibacter phosphoraccumulans EoVTN8]
MKASLQLKGTQHLTMTPQLQQSIRLLQLSSVELQQEVAQALAENPMLERDEAEEGDEAPEAENNHTAPSAHNEPHQNSQEATESGADSMPDTAEAFEQSSPMDMEEGPYVYAGSGGDDSDNDYEHADSTAITLREHLLTQAGLQRCSWREQALVRILIEVLDDRGYLTSSLDEILAALPDDETVTLSELEAALARLHELDPPGVGSRTLTECLLLQLKDLSDANAALARTLVTDYLPALAQRDFVLLRRKTGADDDALRDAQALIRSLNPHPGNGFLDDASPYIIPDVLVRKVQSANAERWTAATNPDVLPRLKINRLYAGLIGQTSGGHSGLSGQLQEARWLIKNIQQRFETIERVAQAIVSEQAAFFEKGELAMRPLVLREIADQLGLHESTISRVTSQKFMATTRGVFEFKYFFGSHVGTDDGGAASATAIKARIKQLIGGENPRKPLSDQQICDQFSAEGIVVARRTIAKYREAMGLPTASWRKTL